MIRSLPPARILSLLLASLFLLASYGARAQEADIRLSGDLAQPVLPADAQIQAADSIGELALVVWGSTVEQGGARPRTVLLMQMIRGNVPAGPPQLLTSPEARPSGFVQVMAVGGRFLVLWNDRREGPLQAYLRRVGGDGGLSAEEQLDPAAIAPQGAAWGMRTDGYDILWNSADGTIRGRMADTGTAFRGASRLVAEGSFARALPPGAIPATIALDRGVRGWLLLSGDQAPRTVTSPEPYHVGNDGSFIALSGGRLVEYASLADLRILRSADLPIPDTAIAGSLLVGRDAGGRPLVTYTIVQQRNIGTDFTLVYLQPYAITETAPGTFSAPQPAGAGAQVIFTTSCHTVSVASDSVRIERACMNRSLVSFHLGIVTTAPDGCSPPSDAWSETVSLVFADSILFSPSQRYPYRTYDPCDILPSVKVLRLQSDSASMVAFVRDSATVRLSAPVAMETVNLPETDPALACQEHALMVGWRTAGTIPSATAGLWNPSGGGFEERGRLALGALSDASARALSASLRSSDEDRSMLAGSGGGGAVLAVKAHRRGEFAEYAYEWDDNAYYRLSRSGWEAIDINRRLDAGVAASLLSVKYNPDEKTTLLAMQRTSPATGFSWAQLILWDSLGDEIWRGDSVPWVDGLTPQYIPLGDSQSIVAYLGGMRHIDGTTPGEEGTTAGLRQGGYAPFIKLYGNRMAQPYEINFRGVFLEILGTDFTIPATSPALRSLRTLPNPPFDMLALLQHPLDSGLIFLYGDSAGIHMDLFNARLVPQRTGVTVSATTSFAGELSALMHGDSLVVAWTDLRNGPADIYGRALRLAGTSGVATPGTGAAPAGLHLEAAPNPAGNSVQFSWNAAPSARQAAFIVTDMLGNRVAQFTAPSADGRVVWDSSRLPPGIYHVAVIAGDRRGVCKLIRQ